MKRKLTLILLAVAFLLIASVSAYQLYGILSEYKQGEEVYDDLSQHVTTPSPQPTPEDIVIDSPYADIVWPAVDFDALRAINDDVVGWIYLDGTQINYPIVKGEDNEYDLNRLFDGKGNGSGSIFMDYRNAGDFTDRNNIIYGHRMNNGSMFADVANYSNRTFFEENPHILIITPEHRYVVEVFSAHTADVVHNAWDLSFDGDDRYVAWLEDIKSRSYFDREVELNADTRVVTLSTCTYEFENARFVVHGIIHEVE